VATGADPRSTRGYNGEMAASGQPRHRMSGQGASQGRPIYAFLRNEPN
jgi:hypothetical protein